MDPEKWLDYTQNISKEILKNNKSQNMITDITHLNKAWQIFSSIILQNAKKYIPCTSKTSQSFNAHTPIASKIHKAQKK